VFARPQLTRIAPGRCYSAGAQVDYILWLRAAAERAAHRRNDPSRMSGQLAGSPVDRLTAEKLVRWIDWNSHDRERVFERLTLAGSGRHDVLLGL
jgi:hypothetical protein